MKRKRSVSDTRPKLCRFCRWYDSANDETGLCNIDANPVPSNHYCPKYEEDEWDDERENE